MLHHVVIAPDFDIARTRGIPTDWRPGVRVAVVDVGLTPGRASTLLVLAILVGVVALGATWGAINGTFVPSLRTSAIIAVVLAACYGILAIVCHATMPEQETVIDWKQSKIMRRRGRRWQEFALDKLTEVKVASEPDSIGSIATIQLLVENQPIPLIISDSCTSLEKAYELIGVAAKHLATTLNVPVTVPEGIDPEIATKNKREWSDDYVSTGGNSVMQMRLANMKGNAQEAERHRLAAMDYFDIANKIDPTNPAPILELGNLSNDDRISEQAIEMAVSAAPDSPAALVELGRMHDRRGRTNLAEQSFDEAVRLDQCINTLSARGLFHHFNERFRESIQDYGEAINLAGEEDQLVELLDSRADCYYDWYESSADQKYMALALADLRKAVSLDPDKSTSLCRLLIAAESFTEAIAALDNLISDGDDSSYAYGLRGRAFLEQGVDMDSAVCDFTRAIELDEALPETSDPQWKDSQKQSLAYLYSLRGEAHEKNGALEKARRDAEKSHELDPE